MLQVQDFTFWNQFQLWRQPLNTFLRNQFIALPNPTHRDRQLAVKILPHLSHLTLLLLFLHGNYIQYYNDSIRTIWLIMNSRCYNKLFTLIDSLESKSKLVIETDK